MKFSLSRCGECARSRSRAPRSGRAARIATAGATEAGCRVGDSLGAHMLARATGRWLRGCVLVLCVAALAGNAAAKGDRLAVLGFQSDSDSPRLIDRNARAMTLV